MTDKGRWVALAGIDGAGKTTQVRCLETILSERDYRVRSIVQLDTPMGKYVDKILTLGLSHKYKARIRALVFGALNYYMMSIIEPELEEYDFIITDRSPYCAFAYLVPQGISLQWIETIYRYSLCPDVTILIDVPVSLALTRKSADERVAVAENGFLENVRRVYKDMVDKGLMRQVDGSQSIEAVTKSIVALITRM